jgi:hypothetical protein
MKVGDKKDFQYSKVPQYCEESSRTIKKDDTEVSHSVSRRVIVDHRPHDEEAVSTTQANAGGEYSNVCCEEQLPTNKFTIIGDEDDTEYSVGSNPEITPETPRRELEKKRGTNGQKATTDDKAQQETQKKFTYWEIFLAWLSMILAILAGASIGM